MPRAMFRPEVTAQHNRAVASGRVITPPYQSIGTFPVGSLLACHLIEIDPDNGDGAAAAT